MSTVILSDQMVKEYSPFVTDTLAHLAQEEVTGITIFAKLKSGATMTGYWNINMQEKVEAAGTIYSEAIDEMIIANIDRYKAAANEAENE